MCDPRSLDHPGALQFNWLSSSVLEQSHTVAKQDRKEDQTEKQIVELGKNNSLQDDPYGCIRPLCE